VIEAIRRGVFWPPAARLRYDDFGALFQGDMQSCFEPPELPVEPEQLELPAEPAPEG
jgi:hypothetical protein